MAAKKKKQNRTSYVVSFRVDVEGVFDRKNEAIPIDLEDQITSIVDQLIREHADGNHNAAKIVDAVLVQAEWENAGSTSG